MDFKFYSSCVQTSNFFLGQKFSHTRRKLELCTQGIFHKGEKKVTLLYGLRYNTCRYFVSCVVFLCCIYFFVAPAMLRKCQKHIPVIGKLLTIFETSLPSWIFCDILRIMYMAYMYSGTLLSQTSKKKDSLRNRFKLQCSTKGSYQVIWEMKIPLGPEELPCGTLYSHKVPDLCIHFLMLILGDGMIRWCLHNYIRQSHTVIVLVKVNPDVQPCLG